MLKFYTISAIYILTIIIEFLFFYGILMWILLIISLFIYIAVTIWGVFNIHLQMFVKSYNFNPTITNKIAITFDDGPHTKNTPKLLDLLNKKKAKGSFFLIGKNIVENTEIVKRIDNEGHFIGNHSFYHNNTFPVQSSKKIVEEIEKTRKEIEKITHKANQYFRPPFGVTNPNIAKAISRTGMKTIGWNIRSFDTRKNFDEERIFFKITNKLKGGDVILLHDRTEHICRLTEKILDYMNEKKLIPVTIEELFCGIIPNEMD